MYKFARLSKLSLTLFFSLSLWLALTIANPGTEIWVATGVYTPGINTSDRFSLPPGVAVYGGFTGSETMLSQRSYTANVTILSGDIGGDDTNTDGNNIAETSADIQGNNSDNIIYADGQSGTPITKSTVLDGFISTAGSG